MYLNRNTSVTGFKQRTFGFPERKQLPRSTANSVVSSNNTYDEEVLVYANLKYTHDCTVQRGQ
jgi:hypothetical protein